jgi:hypothetical protein
MSQVQTKASIIWSINMQHKYLYLVYGTRDVPLGGLFDRRHLIALRGVFRIRSPDSPRRYPVPLKFSKQTADLTTNHISILRYHRSIKSIF